MKKLTEVIAQELEAVMGTGSFDISDVVSRIRDRDPESVAAEADRLVNAGLARRIKELLRGMEDEGDSDDGRLFGLPRAIAFPIGDEIHYIDTELARWEHLRGARDLRRLNVERAEHRLNVMDQVMALVEPAMVANPELTLGEALAHG